MLIRIYRFLKRAKLRTKLFISFLAVALLPMIGMGAFSAVIARDSLRDQLESRVADYVDRAGTQLDAAYGRCQEAMDRVVYGDELLTLVVALPEQEEWSILTEKGTTTANAMSSFTMKTDDGQELSFLKDNCPIEDGALAGDSGDKVSVTYVNSQGVNYPVEIRSAN